MRKRYWQWAGLTVALYWLTGALSLQLAVPPGYAVGIWLPAGFSLAALLMGGRGLWPAVAIGSFLVNSRAIDFLGPIDQVLVEASIPALIGLGAAAQAALSVTLVRRFIAYPLRLDDVRSVGLFIALACGVGCLINASLATGILIYAGKLSLENALFHWFTWWVGDGLGVMIGSVLGFVFLGRPAELWRSRRSTVLPLMGLTCCLIVFGYLMVSRWEISRQRADFDRHGDRLHQQIQAEIDRYIDSIYSLRAFFQSSNHVSFDDFQTYAAVIRRRLPGFKAVAWNIWVPPSQRGEYERVVGTETGLPVTIFRRGPQGEKLPLSSDRPEVVIRFISPMAGNTAALGYAISSAAAPEDALHRARQQGGAAATDPVKLIQEPEDELGAVIYLPVGHSAGEQNGNWGFVAGVFRLGDLINEVYAPLALPGVAASVFNGASQAPNEGGQLLFSSMAAAAKATEVLFQSRRVVDFADKQWDLFITADQRFLAGARSVMPWAVMASGMLFTGLLGMFVLVVTGQKHRSDEASEELRMMLGRLNDAQSQLVESEKMASLGGMVAGFAHELNTPLGVVITGESTLQRDLEELQESFQGNADPDRVRLLLARVREASAIVLANAQRAGSMISSFKTVSVDQSTGEERNISLASYLDEILTNFSPVYRGAPHQVKLDCPADLQICTVPGGLTQVVINIIGNSLVHAFPEGQVGEVWIRVRPSGEGVQLLISDNGVGIAPEAVKRIFDPFYTTRRGAGGTGLGLHLVFNIVRQQLKGSISVISKEGEGATFDLRLPLDVRAVGREATAPPVG